MLLVNLLVPFKVGDGAGYLEDAVVGAGRESEPVGDQFEHAVAGVVQLAILFDEAWRHLGVAADSGAFVTQSGTGSMAPNQNCNIITVLSNV